MFNQILKNYKKDFKILKKWNYKTNFITKYTYHKTIIKEHTRREHSKTEKIKLFFHDKDSNIKEVEAFVGMDILEVAHENEIELEGACEGSCACSTCHVILEDNIYDDLEKPSEEGYNFNIFFLY
eukprot:TRINITY_DN2836_c0_g1_i2.p1 TRINITY_DN2836_c0_g1~~TRINITY_DN2836_c0_g1_i2.p1  ORF type:complete len:125 (-),score=18.61 TRINITY_DN2836_c0_g1_i2:378-752(-)